MQLLNRSLQLPRRSRAIGRRVARVGLLAAVGALGACTSLADLLTPGQRNADVPPALLSLQATVALANDTEGEVVTLDVRTTYLRRDGSEVPVSTQSLRLSSAELQPVPVPVDVATCLADPERDGNSGSCAVMLNLALLVNGVVVDRQVIGPIRLTPGQPANLPNAVTLFEIAELTLLAPDGTTPLAPDATLALSPGVTRTLSARVRDSRGAAVTDRQVAWSSSAPEVVSVSSTGVITAVSEGTARVTATLGELSASVSANVARPPVALTIASGAGSGRGTVRSTPAGIDCQLDGVSVTGTCSAVFPANAQVTLRSTPDARNQFAEWGDACRTAGSADACVITLDEARDASARFLAMRTVTIAASTESDGEGRVIGAGLDCVVSGQSTSGSCSADLIDGSELVVSTAPATRQRFAGWSGDCAASATDACTVTVQGSDALVVAGFYDVRTLSVVLQGAGGGAVLGLPDATCTLSAGTSQGPCATTVMHGDSIALTVAPDARSEFTGWGGACTGSEPSCTVALTTARTVTAGFAPRRITLTVLAAGPGAGVVQLDGEPFCAVALSAPDATCTRQLEAGTAVVLRGVASGTQSRFDGFSGACDGTASCTLTVDAPRSVRAEFGLVPVSITVVSSGTTTGSGRVVAETAGGLDCTITLGTVAPSGCSMTVNPFAPVRLTAAPEPASALVAWGEACANATTTTCTVTPTSAGSVSARFTAAIDVQMIMALSTGAGSVTFEIPGVPTQPMCTSVAGVVNSCRFSLPIGATGVFRGVAAPGYQFIGFNGPCLEGTGPVPTCTYRGFGFVREIEAYFQRP